MKFSSGKRIGQSGQQLTTAVLFSFFLHAILFVTILFFHFTVWPHITVPPFYAVKLVDLPADQTGPAQAPQSAPPAVQKHQPAPPKPKSHKKAERLPKTLRKGAVPDLAPSKRKAVEAEQERHAETAPSAPPVTQQPGAASGAKGEKVTVAAQQPDFKFGYYLQQVRSKIGQNWNPPPDASDARVRVIFSVNRSGWIGEVRLDDNASQATFQFRQAAIRAIRASNPFPALPDEFSRQTLDFSVDLTAVD